MKTPFIKLISGAIGALLLVASTAAAIKCYQCNSHNKNEGSCKDRAPEARFLKECSEKKIGPRFDRCRLIRQWVDFEVESLKPDSRVIRVCGWNQTNEKPCYYKAGYGGRQLVCTCSKNGCNQAPSSRQRVSATTLALGSFMAAICLGRPHIFW